MAIRIGTAPDSWGVWFAKDERQIPWQRCLDEIHDAGYEGTELGPWGYMPNDHAVLKKEFDRRSLKLVAETVVVNFLDDEAVKSFFTLTDQIALLLKKFNDAKYIILITDFYNDEKTGVSNKPQFLTQEQREKLFRNIQRSGDYIRKHDLIPLFHQHADTYIMTEDDIEGLFANTDIDFCHDTGHHVYGGGDPVAFYEKHSSRIPFIHIKQCDMAVKARKDAESWPFAYAVAKGVMCEPERGSIDFKHFTGILRNRKFDGWLIVEQDMYPVNSFDDPLPIARKTREYLKSLGL